MAANKKTPYRRAGNASSAQSFDIKPQSRSKQAAFPAVGMTLSSYQNQQSGNRTRKSTPYEATSEPSRWQRFKSKFSRKRVILFFVVLLVAGIGWLGWKFVYNAQRLFGANVFSVLNAKLDGESEGRVNILLAGNSADDPGHQGGTLTDSIMILSIDTKNNTGFMMSVPRDLYVKVSGYGHQKINAVYPAGENTKFAEDGYAKGGMGLLQKTIEEDFGIKTNYYALVNYNALRDAVNGIGGIDFTVQSSDPRGLYDPSRDYSTPRGILVKLSNGTHHLNGQQALNLARARGDARGSYGYANSDFTRTENQRKLILALRSKATSAGVLANPVKVGKLFDSIGGNVDTDMNLGNVRRLYEVTKNIKGDSIQSIGLNDANGENLLTNYRTPRGESALVPAAGLDDYSDIQRFIRRLTSSNLVVRENAQVVLLNGTTKVGLAARESDILEKKNVAVDSVADADNEDYTTTQIIDLSKGQKSATLKVLQQTYTGATVTTTNPFDSKYDADFIIVLGADRVTASSTSTN